MSFDEQPDDPHGECRAEIERLNLEVDRLENRVKKLETKEYLWDLNRCDQNMTPQRGKRE